MYSRELGARPKPRRDKEGKREGTERGRTRKGKGERG